MTKKNYDELLARLDSARLGQQAASTGLVKFQVIDPPAASFTPVFTQTAAVHRRRVFPGVGSGNCVRVHAAPAAAGVREHAAAYRRDRSSGPRRGEHGMGGETPRRDASELGPLRITLDGTSGGSAAVVFTLSLFPISFGSL